MKLLELFSGTGSVGRPFRDNGWDVVSVDLDGRFHPEVNEDILLWDYTQAQTPDVIWASPPCELYSIAHRHKSAAELARADILVTKALEIIAYFTARNPDLLWFMENPDTSSLKNRPVVQNLPYLVLDYCMYGTPYRKRTRIWGNSAFVPKPLCCLTCEARKHGNRHWFVAQRGGKRFKDGSLSPGFKTDTLHALPTRLCNAIFDTCSGAVSFKNDGSGL